MDKKKMPEIENRMKAELTALLLPILKEQYGEDSVLIVKGSEYAVQVDNDEDGEPLYCNVAFITRRGERDTAGGYFPYDGLTAHEDYMAEVEQKEQKKAEADRKREAKKAEADRKRAEKKAIREAKQTIKTMKKEVREVVDLSAKESAE